MRPFLWIMFALATTLLGCGQPPVSPPASAREPAQLPRRQQVEAAQAPQVTDRQERAPQLQEIAGISYLEIITGDARADQELPMIVAIHGLGDQPENFSAVFDGFTTPARLILPRALDEYEPGYSWFPIRARDPDVQALAAGIVRAVDALAPAIVALAKSRPTTGKPIVTGFSQGGMLTFALATRHPDQLASAVAVSGGLPRPLWPTSATAPTIDFSAYPTLVALHGDSDIAVNIGPTRLAIAHLRSLGIPARLREYPGVGHAIPPSVRHDLFTELSRAIATASSDTNPSRR